MLAIYCRTSNSKSGKIDYSIDNQIESGIKLAKQLNLDYKVYIDEGISGTIRERESFMQLMEHIKGKDKKIKITSVYCIDQSRIERDTDIWRFFSAECINNKIKFYPNGIELDLTDLTSKLFADLLSLVNEYYATLTSKKVKLANAKKTSKGKTHGQIAYGYGRDDQNNFIINSQEAEVVRNIFQWKIEGLGNYIIAKKLNESNIKPKQGNIWRGVTIDGIIRNKLYKGIREWNRGDLDNFIEYKLDNYIIEPETWNKANEVYKENKKSVGKKQVYNYLLDEVIYCGKCGQRYFGKKRVRVTDSSYKCRGLVIGSKHVCRENRGVNIEKMDTFVIHHLFKSKALKELLISAPKNEGELKELNARLKKFQEEKNNEEKNKKRLYKLITNPDLADDEMLIRDYTKTNNKLAKLNKSIADLTEKIIEVSNTKRNEKSKSLIESYTDQIDFPVLKKIVNSLVERIEVDYDRDPNSHGGNFIFRIKYKNYDEVSTFKANSTLFSFDWIFNYRQQATNEDQLKNDRLEIINRLAFKTKEEYNNYINKWNEMEKNGNISKIEGVEYPNPDQKNPYSDKFIGNKKLTYMNEIISFTRDELIHVN
jgi:site-specific DNA recombinase